MATVHDLLASKGKQGAVEAGFDRSMVEVAAAYLSDEDSGLGFAYSGGTVNLMIEQTGSYTGLLRAAAMRQPWHP